MIPLKTPAALAFALLSAISSAQASIPVEPDTPPLHGSLVLKSMPLSPIINRKITTWVYLPPGYDATANAATRYPVIYLLHGQPGGWTDCYRSGHIEEMADELINSGQMPPSILVAFDADGPRGATDMTNFCNRASDGYRAEDFIVQDLVPYIDSNYRSLTDADHRALWGYSAGGYGALNLGFKYPTLWHVLCSHAGFYTPSEDAKLMTRILGPQGPLWDQNNPLLTIQKLPSDSKLHVYMDASPNEEDYDGFEDMASALKARGADVLAISRKKAHAWRVITVNCRDSLLFAGRSFGTDVAPKSS